VDSDNVEIRYSLRLMTSLWRHICIRFYITTSRQNTAYSLIIISYLTHVNNSITVLLMNWNVITYSQNIHLSL